MLLARAEMAAVLHACMYVRATLAHMSVPSSLRALLVVAIYIYIYMYICVYIYVYVYIYTYIYINVGGVAYMAASCHCRIN